MNPINISYKMPAEWEEHQRTFISWPVKESMCYPEDYATVSDGYRAIVEAIAVYEPVTVLVNQAEIEKVQSLFNNAAIELLVIEHDDAWLRDNGPTFVVSEAGEVAGVNWIFNAWGEKYTPWDLDDLVASKVLANYQVKQIDAPIVMEGGSFHVDGEGTLITTEECLLHPNRNPSYTKTEIEGYLKKHLDVSKVVWLKNGLAGDETDGHVDNIACFIAPGKIMIQVCDDPTDANYKTTQENLAILEAEVDAKGRKLEIVPVKQPPLRTDGDDRLTLSYLNFYFVNGGIILPVFGEDAIETDKAAIEQFKQLFPERVIHPIDGMAIIREGGNIHCMTQQMPVNR
ncbi:agmatine deiminase family protein [Paraliobacillus sp. X-1268]|uniref:agmatine deiminase family protein n=1 Tax=Paraliobacillus sp. X-1268 TaxID=2213193 RepID=UPI000E3C11A6|nr:agmatine deiminase family protein [Paraliobacillus sp. X-1268]